MVRNPSRVLVAASMLALALSACGGSDAADSSKHLVDKVDRADLPDSPRIDAIVDRGTLRVGTLAEFPFLTQDITGDPNDYAGPAWVLAHAYADALGVKLQVVPVTHETKVAVLASDQVDITIAPLSVSDERKQVVDFVEYSGTGVCYLGAKDNDAFMSIDSFDDIDNPDLTVAFFQGQPTEELVKSKYPKVSFRAVPGSGGSVPVEEILSGRSDIAVVSPQAAGPQMTKAYPDLATFPRGDACLDSDEFAVPTGMAIDKGQPEFLDFLEGVYGEVKSEVAAEEDRVVDKGIGFSTSD